MDSARSPTLRLLAGLAVTLSAVAIYSLYTVVQLRTLRELQVETIDRNRTDSLLLLRFQNGLNSVALAMRDMLDSQEPYPLSAWEPQFKRLQKDLEDALAKSEKNLPPGGFSQQRQYLTNSFSQFWSAVDRMFLLASSGKESEARTQIQISLQARHAALTSAVARLLVQNNEREEQAAIRTRSIYKGAERNVYIFMTAMLAVIVLPVCIWSSTIVMFSNRLRTCLPVVENWRNNSFPSKRTPFGLSRANCMTSLVRF